MAKKTASQRGKASRGKGKRGEREASKLFNKLFGTELRRSQQFCGRNESSDDIVGLPGFAFEVKFRERLNVQEALDKTKEDAADDSIPVLLHRKSRAKWLVTMELEDLPEAVARLYYTLSKSEEARKNNRLLNATS